jgi:hypothetical protein
MDEHQLLAQQAINDLVDIQNRRKEAFYQIGSIMFQLQIVKFDLAYDVDIIFATAMMMTLKDKSFDPEFVQDVNDFYEQVYIMTKIEMIKLDRNKEDFCIYNLLDQELF